MSNTPKFEWTDELVREFLVFSENQPPPYNGRWADIVKFKQSKQPPLSKDKERIEVRSFNQYSDDSQNYHFYTTRYIPIERYEAIKQAIENVLNGGEPKTDTVVEDKGLKTGIMSQMDMYQMGYKDGTKYGNIGTYTQSEVDAIREDLDLAICYLKAFVDLNKGGIKADETSKDAKKIIELYESKHNSLNPDNKAYTGKEEKDIEAYAGMFDNDPETDTGKDSKEWEITEVVDSFRGVIKVGGDSPFKYVEGEPIHSVKRLSDNRIISVGDESNKGKISKIEKSDKHSYEFVFYMEEKGGFNPNFPFFAHEFLSYQPAQRPAPSTEKTVTDNTDVACLSLNDVMEIVRGLGDCTTGKDNRSYINSMLYRKVKQKLNK